MTDEKLAKKFDTEKERVFKKYHLENAQFPENSIVDFTFYNFWNYLGKSKEGDYYNLKFVVSDSKKRSFRRELQMVKKMSDSGIAFTPIFVDGRDNGKFIWYLYRTIPGQIAGKILHNYGFGEFFFQDFVIDQIVENLKVVREFKNYSGVDMDKWNGDYLIFRLKKAIDNYHSFLSSDHQKNVEQALGYLAGKKKELDSVSFYLSHNDLHPGNVIVNLNTRELCFIDLEWMGFSNICLDFLYFYVLSWKNPDFQKKLQKAFSSSLSDAQKKEFHEVIEPTYVFILLRILELIEWRMQPDKIDNKKQQEARNFVFKEIKKTITRKN